MITKTNNNTSGEPVKEQAPTTENTSAPAASTENKTAAEASTPATLPAGYLSDGYYATTENGAKYLRTEYIEQYAEAIAASLKGMKPGEIEKMVRELKRSKKRTLPYEARRTAAAELLPAARNLVRHKKAPAILVTFIEANLAVIQDDETWTAFYRHCQAISGLME